jgi:hypothetical protein
MEVKSFGIAITNVAPDFATNIAAGRFHAPVLKGQSAACKTYGTFKKQWMHM